MLKIEPCEVGEGYSRRINQPSRVRANVSVSNSKVESGEDCSKAAKQHSRYSGASRRDQSTCSHPLESRC
jgi:hypothetical protein